MVEGRLFQFKPSKNNPHEKERIIQIDRCRVLLIIYLAKDIFLLSSLRRELKIRETQIIMVGKNLKL